jgi:hypothetical protein
MNGIDNKVDRKDWESKGMRLQSDTLAIYETVKRAERYTDNEMLEFLLSSLLYCKSNRAKFSGFNSGMPRDEVFHRILKYYESKPVLNRTIASLHAPVV